MLSESVEFTSWAQSAFSRSSTCSQCGLRTGPLLLHRSLIVGDDPLQTCVLVRKALEAVIDWRTAPVLPLPWLDVRVQHTCSCCATCWAAVGVTLRVRARATLEGDL